MSDHGDLLNPPGRPCREALRAAEREALMQVLRENDVLSLDGIHSWRCQYPDEYGPCQCADQVTDAILEAGFRLIPSEPDDEMIEAFTNAVQPPDELLGDALDALDGDA